MPKQSKSKKRSTVQTKSISLFDLVNNIYSGKNWEEFTEEEQRLYKQSKWMIHRVISMNVHYIPIVNAIQKYTQLPDKNHYQFLCNLIPQGRQFNKYIRAVGEEKYPMWMIDIVTKHFNVKKSEAIQYIQLYIGNDVDNLVTLCKMYGTDTEDIQDALQL
jgi:hypothetical protein